MKIICEGNPGYRYWWVDETAACDCGRTVAFEHGDEDRSDVIVNPGALQWICQNCRRENLLLRAYCVNKKS